MTRVRATVAAALGMTALAIVAPAAGAGGSPEGAPRLARATEVAQLRRHATVRDGTRWRIGFTDGHTVSAQVRTVTLHRDGDLRAAARSQGCYDA
jgi:hypothetical protein